MEYQIHLTMCVVCVAHGGRVTSLIPLRFPDVPYSLNDHNVNCCNQNLSLSGGLFVKRYGLVRHDFIPLFLTLSLNVVDAIDAQADAAIFIQIGLVQPPRKASEALPKPFRWSPWRWPYIELPTRVRRHRLLASRSFLSARKGRCTRNQPSWDPITTWSVVQRVEHEPPTTQITIVAY
jgi:hypothetical protein